MHFPQTNVWNVLLWNTTLIFADNTLSDSCSTLRVTEIDFQLKYAIFSTACSIVYKYCTRPINKHLCSVKFKDPLDTKHKIFKKKTEFINVMFKIGVYL